MASVSCSKVLFANNLVYTTFTNFSTNYLVMCKAYTDVGGTMVCPPVRKIIHSLKLVDYLHVQADNPWYNFYVLVCNLRDMGLTKFVQMMILG